ncbi:MAG: cation:proton antiporter regulatory subunit [Gracilibacteraceae bacterium]|jgi:TrkA domain protein|nr:cation:proton antiporter regulatory subunit [Gracilibacteraceae bacterium]MDR1321837.1 cation:proton antiporter regulatory subunit [Gracilibacteraceae bacterium]
MDFIKETDLPGIGRKFSASPASGGKIIIIVHDDGVREIYRYDDSDADSEVEHIVSFDDSEARKIAGILGGLAYTPKALDNARVDLKGLAIDWYKLTAPAPFIGSSIGALGIRKNIGVSIIGIIRHDGGSLVNPGPEAVLQDGDTVVMAGTREQINAFHAGARGNPQPAS